MKQYVDLAGITAYDEELKNYTGDLNDLETTTKASLVSAINEARISGGSTYEVDSNGNLIIS